MKYPEIRVALFSVFTLFDIGMALYYNYIEGIETHVSFFHLFGFMFFCNVN